MYNRQGYNLTVLDNQPQGTDQMGMHNPERGATQNPRQSNSAEINAAMGLMYANQTYNVVTQELKAGGNERIAQNMEIGRNVLMTSAAFNISPVATGIGVAFETATSLYTNVKSMQRENKEAGLKRRLSGQSTIGGSIYD